MKLGYKRAILGGLGSLMLCLLVAASASAQGAAPAKKVLLAEDVYKNIQVLRGVPENQFLATMGSIAAGLAVNCSYCHDESTWDTYAKDTPNKQMARKMMLMMSSINQSYFASKRMVTCWTCHRGSEHPSVTPVLEEVYGAPPPDEPDSLMEPAEGGPSVNQVLDKYLQAIGGAQKAAAITSFTAKGTYQGFAELDKVPMEIYAKAPEERTTVIHRLDGVWTTTTDGSQGWVSEPGRPVPLLDLTGLFLDGVNVDAQMSFPAQIKTYFSSMRVGFPSSINDKKVQLVQGLSAGKSVVNLYFDDESGLLVRLVRFTDEPLGQSPTEMDYGDYRLVAGVKMPFQITATWLDGRAKMALTQIQPNVAIDAAKFGNPGQPVLTNANKK